MVRVAEAEQALNSLYRQTKSQRDFILASELPRRGSVSVGTQRIETLLQRNYEVFIDGCRRIVGAAATASMDEVTSQMIASAGMEVADAMQQFASAARTRVTRKVRLARVHELVANEAHAAVLKKYDDTVGSNGHLRYREGQGRLVGRMKQALERPDFIRATQTGIIFGNTAMLDAVAAHWRRLNFGAGKRGQARVAQPAPLRLAGQRLGGQYLRFNTGPSPAFSMPAGFWFDGGGGLVKASTDFRGKDAFYPFGQALNKVLSSNRSDAQVLKILRSRHDFLARKQTDGITGAHFLEAGLFVLGSRLPEEYLKLAKSWIVEAADEVKPGGPVYRAQVLS